MELTQRHGSDGSVSVAVAGEVDLSNCAKLRSLLIDTIETQATPVTLDLGECTFIDSMALGVIVEAGRLVDQNGEALRIANLRAQPYRVFELTAVDRADFFQMTESSESAVRPQPPT
jgi:anti-anti-sigma factor